MYSILMHDVALFYSQMQRRMVNFFVGKITSNNTLRYVLLTLPHLAISDSLTSKQAYVFFLNDLPFCF